MGGDGVVVGGRASSIGCKGQPPSADLRYGEDDSIGPSTLFFAAKMGYFGIFTLYIPPDLPQS